jgi:hypothetical protein
MISFIDGFLPYIRIPTRKILAPSQARNMVNRILSTMDRAICANGGTATLILMNINVGVNNGNNEAAKTSGMLGFWVTTIPIIKGINSR